VLGKVRRDLVSGINENCNDCLRLRLVLVDRVDKELPKGKGKKVEFSQNKNKKEQGNI